MAFQVKNWSRISSSANADVVTLQDGTLQGAPTFFGYISGTDTLATIGGADYFAAQANELSITDLIYVAGTDGEVFMSVAGLSLGPPASVITTTVTPGTGDVDGPAGAVDNDIAVFNGLSGKIIKDGGVTIKQIQNGSMIYAASSAGTDTYAVTLSPVPAAYVNGLEVNFKADVANTGPATLNVNGLGAIAINKLHDQALTTGDIEANQIVTVVYNSTGPKFQVQSQTAISVISGALNTVLQGQGITAEPAYSTATYPPTTTINQLLYSSAANTVTGLATANQAVLTTGATGIPVLTPLATNGQLLIGSTAGVPAAATLTAGANVTITNGANSITIATGSGTTWVDQTTTPVTIVKNTGYLANNAGLVTLNMPATAAVGDEFTIQGQGAGGWLLRMNTGQVANLGASPTTSAGALSSTNRYDAVKLVCSVANTTFVTMSAVGNLTVA